MFYNPLKNSVFRAVWIVLLFSNIGAWSHSVTSAIFMTTLTSSSILISLVQAAATLPIFIFSIPGGVLADFYDRKRLVMFSRGLMAVVAFTMSGISYLGFMSANLLIFTIFLLNIGLAFNLPAWQSISSTLVPKSEIKQAAALNNLSFNLSRCIGPAIAGYYFSTLGPAFLFFLNGVSFLAVIFVFNNQIQTVSSNKKVTADDLKIGLMESLKFYEKFPQLKSVFIKVFLYFLFSSVIWSLLPYIVVVVNKMSGKDLGILTTWAGMGAILSAYSIYYLRKVVSDNFMTTVAMILSAFAILFVGITKEFVLLSLIMLVFGYSWSIAVSVFNGIFQAEVPVHIRSRMIGIYFVVFYGAQAFSSYISGLLVHHMGLGILLYLSIVLLLISGIYLFSQFIFSSSEVEQTF